MNARVLFSLSAVLCALLGVTVNSDAAELLTTEEALERIFGDDVEIRSETRDLTASELLRIEAILEKPLFTDEEKIEWGCPLEPDAEIEEQRQLREKEPRTGFQFFFVSSEGRPSGVAVLTDAPGKWDMVEYMVGMTIDGTVTRVEMLSSQEKRGRDVARRSFLKQFEGKTVDDDIDVTDDIAAVSGATVTSKSACAAVTKAVVLYREFYLVGGEEETRPVGDSAPPDATEEADIESPAASESDEGGPTEEGEGDLPQGAALEPVDDSGAAADSAGVEGEGAAE